MEEQLIGCVNRWLVREMMSEGMIAGRKNERIAKRIDTCLCEQLGEEMNS